MLPEGFVESARADRKPSDGAWVRVCDVEVMEDVVLPEPAIAGPAKLDEIRKSVREGMATISWDSRIARDGCERAFLDSDGAYLLVENKNFLA